MYLKYVKWIIIQKDKPESYKYHKYTFATSKQNIDCFFRKGWIINFETK